MASTGLMYAVNIFAYIEESISVHIFKKKLRDVLCIVISGSNYLILNVLLLLLELKSCY